MAVEINPFCNLMLLFLIGLWIFRDGWQIYFHGAKIFSLGEKLIFLFLETVAGESAASRRKKEIIERRKWRRFGVFSLVIGSFVIAYSILVVLLIGLGIFYE